MARDYGFWTMPSDQLHRKRAGVYVTLDGRFSIRRARLTAKGGYRWEIVAWDGRVRQTYRRSNR